MFKVRIDSWLIKFKKYLFTYRDGFFDLPYLSNSPEVMVEAFKQMPFTKHIASENVIYSNTVFSNCALYYLEVEEGLWVIVTEIAFKKNISTNALYDQEPCDYYFLSHFIYSSIVEGVQVNDITIPTLGWSLYKPGTEVKSYFNKGDKGVFANFAFSKAWFERNVGVSMLDNRHIISQYLESDSGYITWNNIVPNSELLLAEILELMKSATQTTFGTLAVRARTLEIISKFFTGISSINPVNLAANINEADRRLVAKTEKILIDNLTGSFPGIEKLANLLHTSPTKLQTAFKSIHENSIFQFYQKRQMMLALEMLKAEGTALKNIALTFGYQNYSKFSAAFKKHHGILPSKVR